MSENMSAIEVFLVMEMYTNANNYSSLDGNLPLTKAVCSNLNNAAEIIALKKIQEIQKIIDMVRSGKSTKQLQQNMFVIKVPLNEIFVPLTSIKLQVTENNLSEETRKNLQAVMLSYNEIFGTMKGVRQSNKYSNLQVDPSIYQKDRRARELELMRRYNVQPITVKQSNSIQPQPSKPIVVRQAVIPNTTGTLRISTNAPSNDNVSSDATTEDSGNLSVPILQTPLPGLFPGTDINISSTGEIYQKPPIGTASAATSRVTGFL